jgi:hypothetical protein
VASGGLIAWHGATESAAWSSIAAECRTAVFSNARGSLGLARKEGPLPAAGLLRLLFVDGEARGLARLYDHVHEHLEFGRLLAVSAGKRA